MVVGVAVRGVGFLASVQSFLEFYSGVFALVGLSCTVMWGLAATDRLVLSIRLRIVFQVAHRIITLVALGFLGIHVLLKIVAGEAPVISAFVPFVATRVAVGLGTVAALIWLGVTVTGLARARFANVRPWIWRLMHSVAYLCWPIALVHGLTAGRQAALWVTLSYSACLVAVGLGLVVRFLTTLRPKPAGTRVVPVGRRVVPMGRRVAGLRTQPARPPDVVDGALDAQFWASLRAEVRR
jgi:hypothetical protein